MQIGIDIWVELQIPPSTLMNFKDGKKELRRVGDITELKKREEHILTQNELLKEITWHQSHGLRRHVANILALCDLLNNHTADFEEDRERFIDFIFQESKSMDEVIHKIVNLASRENLNFAGFG